MPDLHQIHNHDKHGPESDHPACPDCSVVILAGGLSSRFGSDKANIRWGGRLMINQIVARLESLKCEIIAICRGEQDTTGWNANRIIFDEAAAPAGPLRGIVRGLEHCRTAWAFVLPCDAPLAQPELLWGLWQAATPECAAVLPVWDGHPQPLMALYRVCFAGRLRAMLEAGERSPLRAMKSLPVASLSEEECRALDPRGLSFLNVNTPAELEAALAAQAGEISKE